MTRTTHTDLDVKQEKLVDDVWNVDLNEHKVSASSQDPKSRYGCIVESHESTRPRVELFQPKHHDGHIAGRGKTSMNHYNLVHKFIQMPQAKKILTQKQPWTRNGRNSKRSQLGNWRKSEAKKMSFLKHTGTNEKSTLLH